MKNNLFFSLFIATISALTIFGQAAKPSPTPTRPRVIIVGNPTPSATPKGIPTVVTWPTPAKILVVSNNLPSPTPTPISTPRPFPTATPFIASSPTPSVTISYKTMSMGQLKAKINEAKKLMQSRPIPIALTESNFETDVLRMAFYDWKTSQIDFIVTTKDVFLTTGMEFPAISTNGKNLKVRILRANGVNTAITILDENNQAQTPLVVQYPIERNGSLAEVAYYVSTHPGVGTSEVINAGRLYITNTIDIAREKLREKGVYISPKVADIAERLSTVEHVDHQRFRNEYHLGIYNDVFTLFALNEGNTYRYAVSTAGAGGMVQMIPSTYNMVRNRYYNVGLMPNFVEGMRNHVNAAQAMLLYMQWTWDDLSSRETVANALASGIATQAELMAAGYNSNPARLPIYIKRGGASWRSLIPRETKIYLQIYSSLERYVPVAPRTK